MAWHMEPDGYPHTNRAGATCILQERGRLYYISQGQEYVKPNALYKPENTAVITHATNKGPKDRQYQHEPSLTCLLNGFI